MSGGVVDVRKALEARLKLIAAPLATQWENTIYNPVAGTPYQAVYFLFADPVNLEMGKSYQEIGFMQVSLRYPINNGPGDAAARAQAIREWFPRALTLTANGLTVTINRTPIISPSVIDGDRHVLNVKVPFFANNN